MDPAACRVIYIDDRFNTERWISREGTSPVSQRLPSQTDFSELPQDLQANVNAFLSVFNQVYVCRSGRSFSTKLSELHEDVKVDCTPILACFDVGSEVRHNHFSRGRPRFAPGVDSPVLSPTLKREITFSSESDESYGLQLLSRIASDLQVDEGVKLIIPVAVVQPKRKDSYDEAIERAETPPVNRAPYGSETSPATVDDHSDVVDPQMMLQCLDAGALDVVRGPLDKAGIMGLTVHAYRIYKTAKNEQKGFMASARKRKQSWVGLDEEKPYAYLREAMVRKLLKGICEPQRVIEDYQHRDLLVEESRKAIIAEAVGRWDFCGHDFSEDELVYAGYEILNHALQMPALDQWRMPKNELLRFMQGCQIAYNSFVLYHNFRHAVDVLQSLFYFLLQIGALPTYADKSGTAPPAKEKSPIAKLVGPFEALTLLISAIGHDVGHPGVNNMFLVKLNAPLAQLYNDQSVLESFHCAAYSQILRRHWPVVFHDKELRKLMISSILATDMGVHSDYMQQMGNLQEKIHESKDTDGWSPKDIEAFRSLTCGLLIKCADISNVARPWAVAEKWTYLLQKEFAHQGEMESAVGMETTLFGGPPELGNLLKLANGQIGFMTIFAHPLFANVADLIPAMGFAANEILTNKGVWFTKAEQEKTKKTYLNVNQANVRDAGAISPRTQSPVRRKGDTSTNYFPSSPLRDREDAATHTPSKTIDSPGVKASETSVAGSPAQSRNHVADGAGPQDPVDSRNAPQRHENPRHPNVDATQWGPSLKEKTDIEPSSQIPGKTSTASDQNALGIPNFQKSDRNVSATEEELHDKSRDVGVSMRAGSEAVPLPRSSPTAGSDLSKFKFATSKEDEPVRTFDPQHDYQPDDPGQRSSVPVSMIEHQQQHGLVQHGPSQATEPATDPNSPLLRGGGDDEHPDTLTPIQSTTTASYLSDQSVQASSLPHHAETHRNRAISAPLSVNSAKRGFTVNSDKSCESSNTDVKAALLANGEVMDERGRTRKPSARSVGRRSSRIKLKSLAFWKKKDKSLNGEEQTQAEAS